MRRCTLLLLATWALAACADEAPPRIGIVVSSVPASAADVAAEEAQADRLGRFETVIPPHTADLSDAAQAIEHANALVRDRRVVAVIGHSNSAASLAASQIYNAAGLVQIAPTTTAPIYSRAGPFSFRMVPSDTMQAEYLLMALSHHWPEARRIAVVHVNDDYGRGLMRLVRPSLQHVVHESMYADGADSATIGRLREQIAETRPDVLFWLGRPRSLATLLPALRAALPGLVVICADACDTADVYRNANGAFTGTYFVRFTNPSQQDSAIRAFQQRYRERTGQPAGSEALLTYDAVSLVRAALRDGARTREDVRRYLLSLGVERPAFQGLTGSIEFDATRGFPRRYMLAQVMPDTVVSAGHAASRYGK